jgi:hypothetical protein
MSLPLDARAWVLDEEVRTVRLAVGPRSEEGEPLALDEIGHVGI